MSPKLPATAIFSAFFVFLIVPGSADNGTRSNPYTENFAPKFSYYHHTRPDHDALNSAGGNNVLPDSELILDALPNNYIKLTGSDRMVTGLLKGAYLEIRAHGRIRLDGATAANFNAVAVFADRARIRKRNGYQNRFQDAAIMLPVSSLRENSELSISPGAPGVWPGEANAVQSSVIPQFRISNAAGTYPGIIVKVPQTNDPAHPDVYLFKSVNYSSFSKITNTDSKITLTKLDEAQRPRFTVKPADRVFTEGQAAAGVIITRDTRTEFLAKVDWTLLHGTTNAEHVKFPSLTSGTIIFNPGETEKAVPAIQFTNDGIHGSDKTFSIRLQTKARDNPNEAYVETPAQSSHTYTLTVKNNPAEGPPRVAFKAFPHGSNDGNVFHQTTSEPSGGLPKRPVGLRVYLERPSEFVTRVWYSHRNSEVATHGGGGAIALRDEDFEYTYSDSKNYIDIDANAQWWDIPINILTDDTFEGPEKVVFHLGTIASNAIYEPNGKNARLALTITDAQNPPKISIARVGDERADESVGIRKMRLTLERLSAYPVAVQLGYSGTATRDSDYTAPASVTIPALDSFFDFDINVIDDNVPEFDETIMVRIEGATTNGVNLGFLTRTASLIITDNDGGDAASTVAPASTRPAGSGTANVVVGGPVAGGPSIGLWRIAGEPGWRRSGTQASGLAPGHHEIEFRQFEGYLAPAKRFIEVSEGGTWGLPAGDLPAYIDIDAPPATAVQITLYGASGGQWKLDGEAAWRNSGDVVEGLPVGPHKIHFKAPAGYQRPPAVTRRLNPPPATNHFMIELSPNPTGAGPLSPAVLDDAETRQLPYSLVGRFSSSNGFATGAPVRPRVVLTAGHAVFDDRTLSYVTDARYNHQAHKGFYHPAAAEAGELAGEANALGLTTYQSSIRPRGWVILSGYPDRRAEDLASGMGSGSSGIESQNQDVAAAYFGRDVARGGHLGIRVTDPDVHAPGHWLNSVGPKFLAGYPVTQAAEEEIGRMHASPESENIVFTQTFGRVFRSFDLVGSAGISGGPLIIRGKLDTLATDWKIAGVYLGESVFGVYREIDSEVASLVELAHQLAGDDSTGDNSLGTNSTVTSSSRAMLRVEANAPKSTWRLASSTIPREPGTEIELSTGPYEVRFSHVDGWIKPANISVDVVPGEKAVVVGSYTPLRYEALEAAMLARDPAADPAALAPLGDYNGNGVPNLIEWAFNLDPFAAGHPRMMIPTTGTSGLPDMRIIGNGPTRRIRLEYIRMNPDIIPEIAYTPEFSSGLGDESWAESGEIISRVTLDAVWERIIVEDTVLNSDRRFARVRVEMMEATPGD